MAKLSEILKAQGTDNANMQVSVDGKDLVIRIKGFETKSLGQSEKGQHQVAGTRSYIRTQIGDHKFNLNFHLLRYPKKAETTSNKPEIKRLAIG